MNNYSKLSTLLKREILNFSKKICKGIKKPEYKLVCDMLYGLSESQSCHLSNIARSLKEGNLLKKTIERLSNGLSSFEYTEQITENYLKSITKSIDDSSVIIVDGSDISKPCSTKLESISKVWDGSTKTTQNGYHLFEITALTKEHKMPIPVYTKVYSSTEEGFVSQDNEVLKGLQCITAQFGSKGVRTLDRGYDANVYYTYFLKKSEPFVMRCTMNRSVIFEGKTRNILDVANQFKGKYSLKFKDKKGKTIDCKMSIVPVSLPLFPNKELSLVVVHGFGNTPMMLLSNLKSDDKRLCMAITKVYLMRWRIEEYFKFKKTQFDFENFRVRSLNAIRTLNLLLTVLIGLIGMLSEKQNESLFVLDLIEASKRIYGTKKKNGKSKFIYYAIADGFFAILKKTNQGIWDILKSPSKEVFGQLAFGIWKMGKLKKKILDKAKKRC